MNWAMSYLSLGAYEDGERGLRDALALAAPLSIPYLTSVIRQAIALALEGQGKLADAHALATEVLDVFVAMGEGRMVASTHVYRARLLLELGRPAAEEADAAVAASASYPPVLAEALALRSRIKLEADVPAALYDAREAIGLLRKLGGIDEGEAAVRLAWARALAAAGDPEAAEALAEARARLLARASRIGDERLRASFLENVPEHAATLSASGRG
jgi:hypothetical protein